LARLDFQEISRSRIEAGGFIGEIMGECDVG